jgi:hypothetical protein
VKYNRLIVQLCLFLIALTGCVNYPSPLPKLDFPSSSRVGIINMIEDKFTHTHVGTTILNNFSKKYDFDFEFPQYVESELTKNIIEKCNFEVVKIPPSQILVGNKEDLVKYSKEENKVFLNPVLIPEFSLLAEKYQVDVFLLMITYTSDDYIADSTMRLEGYGLYTRSILGLTGAFAYANLIIQGVSANPPTFIGGEDFNYTNLGKFVKLDFYLPLNIKNLSADDVRKIDTVIKEKSKGVAYRALERTNLIPGAK